MESVKNVIQERSSVIEHIIYKVAPHEKAGDEDYQVVEFGVLAEERFALLFLLVDKVLDIHIKAGRCDALGALRGLLTLLKQQRQEGEQRMSGGIQNTLPLVSTSERQNPTRK